MSNVTPQWTDNVSILAAQALAAGEYVRGTIDLRSKMGAKIMGRISHNATGAHSDAIQFLIRALLNNGAAGGEHPASVSRRSGDISAATITTVNSDSALGGNVLNVADTTGFAAGDIIAIQDSSYTTFARLEFHRVSKTGVGILYLDRPLGFTHTAGQADKVSNHADAFLPIWVPGGSLYEVILDAGAAGVGADVTVQVLAQTYNLDQIA